MNEATGCTNYCSFFCGEQCSPSDPSLFVRSDAAVRISLSDVSTWKGVATNTTSSYFPTRSKGRKKPVGKKNTEKHRNKLNSVGHTALLMVANGHKIYIFNKREANCFFLWKDTWLLKVIRELVLGTRLLKGAAEIRLLCKGRITVFVSENRWP